MTGLQSKHFSNKYSNIILHISQLEYSLNILYISQNCFILIISTPDEFPREFSTTIFYQIFLTKFRARERQDRPVRGRSPKGVEQSTSASRRVQGGERGCSGERRCLSVVNRKGKREGWRVGRCRKVVQYRRPFRSPSTGCLEAIYPPAYRYNSLKRKSLCFDFPRRRVLHKSGYLT